MIYQIRDELLLKLKRIWRNGDANLKGSVNYCFWVSLYNLNCAFQELYELWQEQRENTLIACKSDPAKLPKCWFSVKNFTEKLRSCQLDLGRFLFSMVWHPRWPSQTFSRRDGLQSLFHIRGQVRSTIMNTNRQKISFLRDKLHECGLIHFRTVKMVKHSKFFSEVHYWKSSFQ